MFQFGGWRYVWRLESRSEVRQGVLTFRCVPCISAYGGVKVGGQERSSDVSLWSVHFCLRWSQGRRSDKELRCFFVYCAFVPTVKTKFLCASCICTNGEFMLFRCEIELMCSIFFIFLVHYNFEIFQTYYL